MSASAWTRGRLLVGVLLGLVLGLTASQWILVEDADAKPEGSKLFDVYLCDGTVLRDAIIYAATPDGGHTFLQTEIVNSVPPRETRRFINVSAACGYWYVAEEK